MAAVIAASSLASESYPPAAAVCIVICGLFAVGAVIMWVCAAVTGRMPFFVRGFALSALSFMFFLLFALFR